MLKKEANSTIILCDGLDCNAQIVGDDDTADTVLYAKEKGWKISKSLGDFVHYCPECH